MNRTDAPQAATAPATASSWRARLPMGLVVTGAMVAGAVAGYLAFDSHAAPVDRYLTIKARQYAYDPEVIEANRGDTLHIKLASLDVIHGFFLEGYDVDAEVRPNEAGFRLRHPSRGDAWQVVDEVAVPLTRAGKFRFRCSHTCGTMHPFMNGVLLVAPNHVLHAGLGSAMGLLVGFALVMVRRARHA